MHAEEQPLVNHYHPLPIYFNLYILQNISVIRRVCGILEQYGILSVKSEKYYTLLRDITTHFTLKCHQPTHFVTLRSTANIPILNVGHVQKKRAHTHLLKEKRCIFKTVTRNKQSSAEAIDT